MNIFILVKSWLLANGPNGACFIGLGKDELPKEHDKGGTVMLFDFFGKETFP